jgi:hypothetical protein
MTTRTERLLNVLDRHPAGLAAEVLVGRVCQLGEDRQLLLKALRTLEAAGQVRVSRHPSSPRNSLEATLVLPIS